MMPVFREKHPRRTCNEFFSNYKDYKNYLREDFNHRCGYTDCRDSWFGGKNTFHIDHFKPKQKYSELETNYSNLVYCCSYVNILKRDDDSIFYLDPCEHDYNDQFERGEDGRIIPKSGSTSANYMYRKFKLYLRRYQVIWLLDQIEDRLKKLVEEESKEKNSNRKSQIKDVSFELLAEYLKYKNFLEIEL